MAGPLTAGDAAPSLRQEWAQLNRALRVAVIGASGNVGTAFLRGVAASRPDWEVIGICRRPPPAGEAAYARVSWRPCDIAEQGSEPLLAGAFRGVDAVVHAAWRIQPSHDHDLLHRTNVDGTRRIVSAARTAGVAHLVYVSSIGAYAPSDKSRARDESWDTSGVPGSTYSRQKTAVERLLDDVAPDGSGLLVTRLRPGLVFQRDAASEVARYFLGPLVPQGRVGRVARRLMPLPDLASVQAVHADDVCAALIRILDRRATGAFNLAADPVLTPDRLAAFFGARRVVVPAAAVRAAAAASYHLRLQPTEPGWVALALSAPAMDCSRAVRELDWTPTRTSEQALADLLGGMRDRAGTSSPALRPRSPLRPRSALSALARRAS